MREICSTFFTSDGQLKRRSNKNRVNLVCCLEMNYPALSAESVWEHYFDVEPHTRLVFGLNSVDRAGELAAEIGGKRILLVTDRGIVAAGHAERVERSLK